MNTTTPQLTHTSPQLAAPRTIAPRRQDSASPDRPTRGETFVEPASIIGAPAFFGPPIIFALGLWLLGLLLIGPFALIFTLLLVLAAAAGLLAVLLALVASPYLLIRQLHAHGMVHPEPRASLHPSRQHRVSPGPLRSPQPKGVT